MSMVSRGSASLTCTDSDSLCLSSKVAYNMVPVEHKANRQKGLQAFEFELSERCVTKLS